MEQEIKITAEPQLDPEKCLFSLEKPLYDGGGSYTFHTKTEACASPLAEYLFEIPEIVSVFISSTSILATKQGFDSWKIVGPKVGKAIRSALASKKDLISQEKKSSLPAPNLIKEKVTKVLEEKVNPSVASHGGYIELLDVKVNDIYIKMGGGCQGCASSTATLRQGVERTLRSEVPELGMIFDTTNHAAGTNPYFQH